MPDASHVPSPEEMAWLRARVAELESENEVLAAQLAARDAQLEAAQARLAVLAEQIEDLRRRLDKDSSTSSRPPSSDNPYKKKPRDRSLRGRSGRKPGKQPGAQSSTRRLRDEHWPQADWVVPDAAPGWLPHHQRHARPGIDVHRGVLQGLRRQGRAGGSRSRA